MNTTLEGKLEEFEQNNELDDEDEDLLNGSLRINMSNLDETQLTARMQTEELKQEDLQTPSNQNAPDWDDYKVEKLLGEGAFGKVYKVQWKEPFSKSSHK